MKNKKKNSVVSKLFKKRNTNKQNDMDILLSDAMYAPNMGISPKKYIAEKVYDLEQNDFKALCMDFLKNAKPDEYNASYMDAVIENSGFCDIKDVYVQRCDHIKVIKTAEELIRNGDLCHAKDQLQYFLEDRDEIDRKLVKYRRIYWAGTSLAEEV